MNKLKVFEHAQFGKVRTVTIDGEPWIVGRDVAEALGYTNTRDAIGKHVDEDDKGVAKCDTPGGEQEIVVINESGVYSLILGSKLPTAKQFKRWVTSEVLPSIRKHGMYATEELLENPDLAIEVFRKLKEEREQRKALETTIACQKQQIAEMQPKVTYYDIVLQCKGVMPISQIAKDFGMSGRKLNEYLCRKHIQFRQGKNWLLYDKYARMGYTQSKTAIYDNDTKANVYTCWTQKGRLFLYETLKKDNILPMIERSLFDAI